MKYVSIDIETTGLKPGEHQVLEIGAVIDDTEFPGAPVKALPMFRCLIVADDWNVGPYCAALHKDLWDEMLAVDQQVVKDQGTIWINDGKCVATRECALLDFRAWLDSHNIDTQHIVAAGKNFANFDKRFLAEMRHASGLKFKHRTLDPVTFWTLPEDEAPPNLTTCCSRANIELVGHHTAVADARTVIRLLRAQWALQAEKQIHFKFRVNEALA